MAEERKDLTSWRIADFRERWQRRRRYLKWEVLGIVFVCGGIWWDLSGEPLDVGHREEALILLGCLVTVVATIAPSRKPLPLG
jgi:hypothetical protein